MDNQHKFIRGYRDLSEQEIELMNEGKDLASQVGAWIEKLEAMRLQAVTGRTTAEETPMSMEFDARWLAVGKTDLQKGFMAVIRSIARPETF